MATQLPQFAQRALRRKTAGIDRLSTQFRKDIEALTGKQESSLAAYQAGVREQLKPFEAAKTTYETVSFPAYEAQMAAYNERLKAYESELAAVKASPTVTKTGYYQQKEPRFGLFGLAGYETKTYSYEYEEPKPLPTFTEKKPTAPEAPTAPTIAAFDTSAFETERKGLEAGLQRELGERRAARLAAVSRRGSRPMLQGA
jgi:hypothetical protein